jgi:hypothetical protein
MGLLEAHWGDRDHRLFANDLIAMQAGLSTLWDARVMIMDYVIEDVNKLDASALWLFAVEVAFRDTDPGALSLDPPSKVVAGSGS